MSRAIRPCAWPRYRPRSRPGATRPAASWRCTPAPPADEQGPGIRSPARGRADGRSWPRLGAGEVPRRAGRAGRRGGAGHAGDARSSGALRRRLDGKRARPRRSPRRGGGRAGRDPVAHPLGRPTAVEPAPGPPPRRRDLAMRRPGHPAPGPGPVRREVARRAWTRLPPPPGEPRLEAAPSPDPRRRASTAPDGETVPDLRPGAVGRKGDVRPWTPRPLSRGSLRDDPGTARSPGGVIGLRPAGTAPGRASRRWAMNGGLGQDVRRPRPASPRQPPPGAIGPPSGEVDPWARPAQWVRQSRPPPGAGDGRRTRRGRSLPVDGPKGLGPPGPVGPDVPGPALTALPAGATAPGGSGPGVTGMASRPHPVDHTDALRQADEN